jgi:hypothetical protein
LNASVSTQEHAAGEFVARAIAMSLQDPAVRAEVKTALATSTVREHKLHLASFLAGRGGRILQAAYRNSHSSEGQFQAQMAELRELEFYMPVSAHRAAWSGGPNVLVAVSSKEGEAPVAFSIDGERTVLSLDEPPTTPTLVMVPRETDFADQIRLNQKGVVSYSCEVNQSATLAAAGNICASIAPTPASFSKAPAALPVTRPSGSLLTMSKTPGASFVTMGEFSNDPSVAGLYATFLRALDLHEYWDEGDPEVEIHVTGKRNGPGGVPIDYQCSAEYANDPTGFQPGIRDFSYVFNMNANFWQDQEVRILNAAQLDSLLVAEPDGFNVSMWESDGQDCQINQASDHYFENAVAATAAIARGVNAMNVHPHPDLATAAGVIFQIANLLQGGDDLIGEFVFKDSIPAYAGTNPSNNYMIFDHTTENGRATLILKRTTRVTSVSGQTTVASGANGSWSGSVTGAANPVNYTWIVNGNTVQDGASAALTYPAYGNSFAVGVTASDPYGPVSTASMIVTVPPAITALSVSGPNTVSGCTGATWTAARTGGVAPVTYVWTVEGETISTDTSSQLAYTNSGNAFSIFVGVTATDANGSHTTSSNRKTNVTMPGSC